MLSTLLPLLATTAAFGGPFVTVEYSPLSRGDIVWSAEQQTSGLLVGEFDGFVNPSLKTHLGFWATPHVGITTSLGVARLQTTTWFEDDVFVQGHVGVIRPGFDLRYAPFSSSEPLPLFWLSMGAYIDIASSRDVSNGYTESEQELANEIATNQVEQLRGLGSRIGFGLEKQLVPGVAIGMMSTLIFHRVTAFTAAGQTTSGWSTGDTSLLLTFAWPSGPSAPPSNDPMDGEGIYTSDPVEGSSDPSSH